MNWKLLWPFVGFLLALPQTGMAQVQTIRKEVRQIFGGSQSADDARVGAIARAKREALEEAGTYLESLTIVRNRELQEDEILALSSGVLGTTVVEEEPFLKGGAFGIRVVVEVEVDLSTLEERVRLLLDDRQHLATLREAERRERELLKKLGELEVENARMAAAASARQREALRAAFDNNTAQLIAQELLDRGLALWNGMAFVPAEQAIDYFTQAIAFDPNYAVTYSNRGWAYENLGEYQLALEDLKKAIRTDPNFAVAYNNRGNVYYNLHKYRRAISDYSRAIRLDPINAIAYNNRGNAYHNRLKFRRAIEDYDQTILLDPNFAVAYNNRGSAYDYLGEYQLAIEDYSQAIELDPTYMAAYYNRGNAYGYLGEYQLALKDLDQAIRFGPNFPTAYNDRGNVYYNLQEYQRAIGDYNQAVHIDTNLAVAYYNRGFANDVLGQQVWASRDWNRACELGYQPACELERMGVAVEDITFHRPPYEKLRMITDTKTKASVSKGTRKTEKPEYLKSKD